MEMQGERTGAQAAALRGANADAESQLWAATERSRELGVRCAALETQVGSAMMRAPLYQKALIRL